MFGFVTFIKWKVLKCRLGLSNDIRWYDRSSGNLGYYHDQSPTGIWEILDFGLFQDLEKPKEKDYGTK